VRTKPETCYEPAVATDVSLTPPGSGPPQESSSSTPVSPGITRIMALQKIVVYTGARHRKKRHRKRRGDRPNRHREGSGETSRRRDRSSMASYFPESYFPESYFPESYFPESYFPRCLSKNNAISVNTSFVSGAKASKLYWAWDMPSYT
jgi:hypothetical protein